MDLPSASIEVQFLVAIAVVESTVIKYRERCVRAVLKWMKLL
jgi:hypothetical protein